MNSSPDILKIKNENKFLRIVGGKYRSRILKAPKDDRVRPTSDKLRVAIFNMLRSRGRLQGAQAIDVFCGTGALGLEALSQGAETCVFVDSAKDSLALAKENAIALKIGAEAVFLLKEAAKLGARPANIAPRDLVFLDPPYNKNLIVPASNALQAEGWLAPNAFFVIEAEKGFSLALENIDVHDSRDYGATTLILASASSK